MDNIFYWAKFLKPDQREGDQQKNTQSKPTPKARWYVICCTAQTFSKKQSDSVSLQRPPSGPNLISRPKTSKYNPRATGTVATQRVWHWKAKTPKAFRRRSMDLCCTAEVIKHPEFGVRPVTYSLKWEKAVRQATQGLHPRTVTASESCRGQLMYGKQGGVN